MLGLAGKTACTGDTGETPSLTVRESAVVYGADNRLDLWADPDANLRELATSTAVALIRPTALRFGDAGTVDIRAAPLSAWDTFCSGTPFLDQPTAATCGAVLIDDDLILTAGHCLAETPSCRDFGYVFGYLNPAPATVPPITREDVYGCRQVAVTVVSPPDSVEQSDFAIVQLDRPVTGARHPTPIGAVRALGVAEPLTVIGFPGGLPVKIDSGAAVVDPRPATTDFFTLGSDTFNGSSGSGVYDAAATLVGIFARGTADTVDRGSCRAVRTLADGARTSAESATYATRAIAALCAAGWPSEKLCGLAPVCGDRICSPPTESPMGCPADCSPATCGDQLCESSEWTSCAADCGDRRPANLPDRWTCDPIWYTDGDTCDCECGAPDPDCGAPGHVRACDSTGPAGLRSGTGGNSGCALAPSSVDPPPDAMLIVAAMMAVIMFEGRRRRRGCVVRPCPGVTAAGAASAGGASDARRESSPRTALT